MSTSSLESTASHMNTLAAYLGQRDITELTQRSLENRFGFPQADVMALFGGSILAGGDVLADAMRMSVAKCYVIVGGAGHTTSTLHARAHELCPKLKLAKNVSEAEVFAAYLKWKHGLEPDLLETESTNCGNNLTFLNRLLGDRGIRCKTLILAQDATMQRRMMAGIPLAIPGVRAISYATYAAHTIVKDGRLEIADPPLGMWDIERYRTLLMGEIPRLTDNKNGYGPNGTGFIAHVDVPQDALFAWKQLCEHYPEQVRTANPAFSSVP